MAVIELSIDLGSSFITIFQKGIGLVLREPSVAIVEKVKEHFEIKEAGYKAETIINDSLAGAQIITPIKEGIVVDDTMCALLVRYFLDKIVPPSILPPRIKAICMISSTQTNSERRACEKALVKAGIKEVTLVESPLALLAYTDSIGGLIVDMGGGKTEISAVTRQGIVAGNTINIGGNAMNGAIIDSIFKRTGVKIGEYTIENLKKSALSFYKNDEGRYPVCGGSKDGSPRSLIITAEEMFYAVKPLVDNIVDVICDTLSNTPPELAAEIMRKGIFITGGCTRIPGLVEYIRVALDLPVTEIQDNGNAVAIGGSRFFDDKKLLSDMLGIKMD